MKKIHNTAIIGKNSIIGSNVEIGPYCVIEDGVKIGNENILHSSAVSYTHLTLPTILLV